MPRVLSVLPYASRASCYRSSEGAAIDLLLELPKGLGLWAIEIEGSLSPRPDKGFCHAIAAVNPSTCFVVYAGEERYLIAENIEVMGLKKLCKLLQRRVGEGEGLMLNMREKRIC